MTTTTSTVTTYFNVTSEQIEFCTRIEQDGKVYYMVASQTTIGQDYKVQFNHQHHVLQCNCKAGAAGMNCWHKRAALAHNKLWQAEKQAELEASRPAKESAEQHQIECYVGQGIDRATAERVVYARPAKASTAKGNLSSTNRAFSLLK